MTSDTDDRDEWGFSEADHAELQALMQRYEDRVYSIFVSLMQCGVRPEPDDPGFGGVLAQAIPDAPVRLFPPGGLWWALLDALRELDASEQRA